jgi:hypothetical protein
VPLASEGQIPFRRMTDPLQVPVGPQAAQFVMPANYIPLGANAFLIVNPNLFWMRLKGSGVAAPNVDPIGDYAPVVGTPDGAGTGWLFQPGFFGVFTSQFPRYLSTIAVPKQGVAAGNGFMEISWGMGGW